MDISFILERIRPGASWSLGNSNDYSTLIWHDNDTPPTFAECEAAWGEIEHEYRLQAIRIKRNSLLAGSDWTQIPDAPVDKNAWAEYRQALRDLPQNTIDPENPVWPTPPNN